MSQPQPPPRGDGDPELEVFWLSEENAAGSGSGPGQDGKPRSRLLLIVVASVVLVGILITVILTQVTGPDRKVADPGATTSAPSAPASSAAAPTTVAAPPTTVASAETPTPTADPTPTREPKLTDPPSRDGANARIRTKQDGTTECKALNRPAPYGDYPAARCHFWHKAQGLRTGQLIRAKQSRLIACQRDLKKRNPHLADNQDNTWWVWTRSDRGTWDWFPETAVEEGGSYKPIRRVAICRS